MRRKAKYNGWTNYVTWNWALWMDQGDNFAHYAEVAIENDMDVYDIADMLKNVCEDEAPKINGPYSDIMNAGISEINWQEIAEHVEDRMEEM